ncbi:MAG: 16S rRNA (adenine(1518)-N(6)/adenine(1519)-N(6))-dimethyltransferase RsmA [Erysipelotrichaceae bacterium]
MKKAIATPSRTREILETYHLFAKKNYGQNFLIEPGIVEKIARNAVISDHSLVIEIGPGIGALTQYLAEYATKVISFEIDDRLIEVLNDTLSEYDNVDIIHQDFLDVDLKAFCEPYLKQGFDIVIAANLPYYITTPILFKIFEADAGIKAITVMMQKEVADRFGASVNTKDYNALSVVTQYRCNVKAVMKVGRNVFQPKPAVDSSVVQFTFKEMENSIDETDFFLMVKACFKQRRKTIRNNYLEYVQDKDKALSNLHLAGIDEARRAESLTLTEFKQLYEVSVNDKTSTCED